MLTEYQRPPAGTITEHEVEIKRSRFICLLGRVENELQAREFIDAARARFPDARHHCSAYIYHQEAANPVERSSDDGEPSGTAGKPMLDVLKGSGMLDLAAVVVRYFGGVKLGAGGLVHAYGGVVSETVEKVTPIRRALRELYLANVGHHDAGRIEAELRSRGYVITNTDYHSLVTFTIAITPGGKEKLADTLAALSSGTVDIREAGTAWVESA